MDWRGIFFTDIIVEDVEVPVHLFGRPLLRNIFSLRNRDPGAYLFLGSEQLVRTALVLIMHRRGLRLAVRMWHVVTSSIRIGITYWRSLMGFGGFPKLTC